MVHRNIKYFALFLVLFSLIVLPGCKVGPKYVRPAVKADNIYRFANSGDTLSIADLEWVTLYKDTVLHQLVTNGLKNNYDIRSAFARISEAQAAFKKSRGDQWPMFSLQANAGAYNQQLAGLSVEYQQYNALAGMSWEIDLWGKYRRAKEAARANLMAQTAFRQMVRITLIHDIVGSYFNLLELDNELRIIRENIIIRQKSLDLVKAKMIAGTASGLVVAQ
ncbi:MAG: TolC family protein, partial [Bacteroidota bacterium]